jgi:hypothetical protein
MSPTSLRYKMAARCSTNRVVQRVLVSRKLLSNTILARASLLAPDSSTMERLRADMIGRYYG